ncbi:raffinose/stachyose/melibiose transport system substrate-binding protein [Kribbella sp. VKM Ac-2527]|uniref:Raffinose/stachyose/melibiose transport system substrate-binding protein n=1 Tax=Kribbella caucasensis TaxID=2512215 RepID=A0A4R6KKI4_9ACTN|nr:raffinose/stachyose/melibiose transport system substrate-binding protein [Kribbella sp. VKM Ac-2527]
MVSRFITRKGIAGLSLVISGLLAISACAGGGSQGAGGNGDGKFSGLTLTATTDVINTLNSLSTGDCQAQNTSAPLTLDAAPQDQYDQRLQLLLSQNGLPSTFLSPGTPDLGRKFIDADALVNVSQVLNDAGLKDAVLPAASSLVQQYYGSNDLYALPVQLNIEGIWYNKQIFAQHGIAVPTTWDQFLAAVDKFQAAGVQPIAQNGANPGWGITRWLGAYIFRALGPDAMRKVADGNAKLTDPQYVAAADQIAKLGAEGVFGKAVASADYNQTVNTFLTGRAAMMYMGSWITENIEDPKQNKVGAANIGFMRFPAVTGGAGAIDQMPANAGQPLMFAKSAFGDTSREWLKCIAQNYGDTAFEKSGLLTGMQMREKHDLSPLQRVVVDQVEGSPSTVLWFEALFSSQATTISTQNAGQLANGSMSGTDFMASVQAALGK